MDEKPEKKTLFEKHKENVYFRWGLTAVLVVIVCIIVAQIVAKLAAIFTVVGKVLKAVSPLFYGLAIAYLLDPIVNRVEIFLTPRMQKLIKKPKKAARTSRAIGVLCALILLVLIIWALLAMVLPQLFDSLATIFRNLPVYYTTLRDWISGLLNSNMEAADYTGDVMDSIYSYFTDWLNNSVLPQVQSAMMGLTVSVVSLFKELFNIIIGLIISVYLLMGKKRFLSQAKKICYSALGDKRAGYVCNVCSFANQAFGGFIGGKIVDSAIMGVLCFLGTRLLNMPYSLLISIIVGVTNIIPFFGPFLGAIPSGLLLLVINPIQCLYFVIFVLILQQVDGNIIGPLILGDATGLDSLWVIVSILIFGSFYGVIGMIIAAPTFSVIYKIIAEITNWSLEKQNMSTNTTDYEKWNYPPRPESSHWKKPPQKLRIRIRKKRTSAEGSASPQDEAAPQEDETPPSDPSPESSAEPQDTQGPADPGDHS